MGTKRDIIADYFDVFNNEVKQFMEPGVDYELKGSRIHIDSKVRYLEEPEEEEEEEGEGDDESELSSTEYNSAIDNEDGDDDNDNDNNQESGSDSDSRYVTAEESADENTMESSELQNFILGTYWSSREKSIFFHCLSRYSIHRLNEWRTRLPSKSIFDIMLYYNVLKRNLMELRRRNLLGGLVPNEDFPFAYEMDNFYVEWEEFTSRQVRIEYERPMNNKRNYITDIENRQDEDREEDLISVENWNKRWQAVYCKTGIEELKPLGSEPLPYSKEAFEFLNSCAEAYTRKLLWFTVLQDMEKLSVSKSSLFPDAELVNDEDLVLHAGDEQLPHVVTHSSVLKALNTLKQEGFYTPTIPDTVLKTLEKFEIEPNSKGKLFRNNQVTMSLLPSLLKQGTLDSTPFDLTSSESLQNSDPEPNVIHKKLYTIENGKRRRISGSFVEDDPYDSIENPLEIDLCDWEAQLLEEKDLKLSKLHQHMLLTYYSSTKNPTTIQLEPESPDQAQEPCPVDGIPSTLLNLFMHSNS